MKITLKEKIDTEKLAIIIENWNVLKDKIGCGFDLKTLKNLNSEGTLTIFKKMLKKKQKTLDAVYTYSGRKNHGRMYCEYSLQGCHRCVRHTIAQDLYWDIDIKNCHPVILCWLCNINDIPCETLSYYVNNRDDCLKDLMSCFDKTKDEVKQAVLSVMNGGDVSFDCSNAPEWFKSFFIQIQNIHSSISAVNPKLMKEAIKQHGSEYFNLKGSVCNKVLCDYENKLLQCMYQTCLDNDLEVGAFVFDGLMIEKKDNVNLELLLHNMEVAVKRELGIDIEIIEKPMNEGLDLSNFSRPNITGLLDVALEEKFPFPQVLQEVFFNSHEGYARAFYELYGQYYVKTIDHKGNGFVWDETSKLWKSCKSIFIRNMLSTILVPQLTEIKLYYTQQESKAEEKSDKTLYQSKKKITQRAIEDIQNTSFKKNVLEALVSFTHDPDFITSLNISKFLIPIKNSKILNLKTLETRSRSPTDLFSYELDVNFIPEHSLENAKGFMKDISCNDDELYNFLNRLMGYFLTNDTGDRGFYIFWGTGCNGKSTLFKIMKNIMLQGYTGISKNVLVNTHSRSSLTPELEVLIYARLAVLSEIKENEILDESNIKSLTGGDVITCNPKNRDPIQFVPNCKLVMLCNDKPKFNIDDPAMIDRLKFIPFNARFEKNASNNAHCQFLTEDKDCLSEFFTLFAMGANRWFAGEELTPVSIMTEALDTYVNELDVVQQWVEDCCETDPDLSIKGSDAWSSFLDWNVINCGEKTNKQAFARMLEKRFQKKRLKSGIVYKGLAVKEKEPEYTSNGPPL